MCPRQVTRKDEGKLLRIARVCIPPEEPRTIRVFVVTNLDVVDIHMNMYSLYHWRAVSEGFK